MSWNDIWMIVCAIVASCGGVSVIILGVSGFLAKMIEKRLEMKYSQILTKELENYKSTLDRGRYITKTQFDRQYEIYGTLSKAFASIRYELSAISIKRFYTDKETKGILAATMQNVYERSLDCLTDAQNLLYENAPFIPEDIYNQYLKLNDLANEHFLRFQEAYDAYSAGKKEIENLWTTEDEHRYKRFALALDELNKKLREYLEALSVCE